MAGFPSAQQGGGDHQSEREARWTDRCVMGDDTKYAVVWPETDARLSEPCSAFHDGIAERDVCASCISHALCPEKKILLLWREDWLG